MQLVDRGTAAAETRLLQCYRLLIALADDEQETADGSEPGRNDPSAADDALTPQGEGARD